MIQFLETGNLPDDMSLSRKIAAQALQFSVVDGILYFVKSNKKQAVVPVQLRQKLLQETHGGILAGHFSANRSFHTLSRHWWWDTMYKDCVDYCKSCVQCAMVKGTGKVQRPPLHPIPVQRPFQNLGVDIMELLVTQQGNQYVIVFQDFLTKWPLVYPAPDQKSIRIAKLLAEEVLPMFGVPEALLSDRDTNLLSHLMKDVCELLGITKLNTTAYHPACNGIVERLNRTLKATLRKHAAKFGTQWDNSYQASCGLTGIPHMIQLMRNLPFYSSGWNYVLPQKQLCCQQSQLNLPTFQTTENS